MFWTLTIRFPSRRERFFNQHVNGCTIECRNITLVYKQVLFSWRILLAQRPFSTDSTRRTVQHFRADDEFKQAVPYVVCFPVSPDGNLENIRR